ncbi:hypothetical protein [Microbacterium sp. RURRCA19A]|uniref:hypothetical protein n=1 Tax=Microbacterium sp. RURRCA19A TaxID=1907391 RepID=UPI0009554175|nr:hypothetical protein [Microbacterium sp. RURRCA19A]SIR75173.1 hypothetical protein SAMN05880568_1297 [Microbacterium sp. RURRCA19A]
MPFQSNGTVVFEGDAERAQDAALALAAHAGVEREVFTLTLDRVRDIVSDHDPAPDANRRELTLHARNRITLDATAQTDAGRRRCVLLDTGVGWVVSLNERARESNATPVLERLTGAPATSSGIPTLERLIDRFSRGRRSGVSARTSAVHFAVADPLSFDTDGGFRPPRRGAHS